MTGRCKENDMKEFVVGKSYYPGDRSYDPITVIRRTPKCIVVRGGIGNEWRMVIKHDHDGTEIVVDSSVPSRWRGSFMYCADDPVKEVV